MWHWLWDQVIIDKETSIKGFSKGSLFHVGRYHWHITVAYNNVERRKWSWTRWFLRRMLKRDQIRRDGLRIEIEYLKLRNVRTFWVGKWNYFSSLRHPVIKDSQIKIQLGDKDQIKDVAINIYVRGINPIKDMLSGKIR